MDQQIADREFPSFEKRKEFYIRMIIGFKFVYYDTEKNKITNRRNKKYLKEESFRPRR